MPKKNVLSNNSLPTRLPIMTTTVCYLVLDRFQPSEWVWGAVGLLVILLWIASIIALFTENHIDLLNKKSNS